MTMRIIRWLAISAALAVGIIAVALLILSTTDLSRFKDDVERYASRATGREFVIDGTFHASFGRSIVVQAEDVRLGNADWSSHPDMLQVGDVELRVNLWSLISGPIWIQYLKLDRTRILVEANLDEQLNWTFDPATDLAKWIASTDVGQHVLERADIEDFVLRYGEGWLDQARTLAVNGLSVEKANDGLLAFRLDGRLGDFSIAASGHAGPLQNLLRDENVNFDITANVGDFQLAARGLIERLSTLERPELSFGLSGPDISSLLAAAGLPAFTSGPLDVRGNLDQQQPGIKLDVTGFNHRDNVADKR